MTETTTTSASQSLMINAATLPFSEDTKRLYYVLESYAAYMKTNRNFSKMQALEEYDVIIARMKNLIDTAYPMTLTDAYKVLGLSPEEVVNLKKERETAIAEATKFTGFMDKISQLMDKSVAEEVAAAEVPATPTAIPKKRGPKPGFKRARQSLSVNTDATNTAVSTQDDTH